MEFILKFGATLHFMGGAISIIEAVESTGEMEAPAAFGEEPSGEFDDLPPFLTR